MKKKLPWSILTSLALAFVVAWLTVVLGRHVIFLVLLSGGAFILTWVAPRRFLSVACILAGGIPLIHLFLSGLHLITREPFSWLGNVILPMVLIFPAALLGALFGSFHNIVKDDF